MKPKKVSLGVIAGLAVISAVGSVIVLFMVYAQLAYEEKHRHLPINRSKALSSHPVSLPGRATRNVGGEN